MSQVDHYTATRIVVSIITLAVGIIIVKTVPVISVQVKRLGTQDIEPVRSAEGENSYLHIVSPGEAHFVTHILHTANAYHNVTINN